MHRLDFRARDFRQHVRPKDEHGALRLPFDFGEDGLHLGACERVAIKRHCRCGRKHLELMLEVPFQVEEQRWRTVAVDVIRNEAVAMEVHDFQRLVEVFHLHGICAELAHLEELRLVAHQGCEGKILGQFLVEPGALLRVVAVDFLEAEKQGHQCVAARQGEQAAK